MCSDVNPPMRFARLILFSGELSEQLSLQLERIRIVDNITEIGNHDMK